MRVLKEKKINIVLYKNIGFALVLISIVPSVFLTGIIRIIIVISILAVAFVVYRKFRCPHCKHIFDPKLKTIEYCNHCGKKI